MILVLDTSLVGAQLALVRDGELVWSAAHRDNAGSLAAIANLFQAAGVGAHELKGIAVSVGPGSFTGIKIGLAFVYGLVAACDRDMGPRFWPDSALGAAAEELCLHLGVSRLGLLLPATRTHGFLGVTGAGGSECLIHTAPTHEPCVPGAEYTARLAQEARDLPLYIVGSWPAMQLALSQVGRQVTEIKQETICEHALRGMCRRGQEAFPTGYTHQLPVPRYLRLSTAEEALVAAGRPSIV